MAQELGSRVLEVVEEVIGLAEERVKGLMKPISGGQMEHVGFVDGSYALEERRGVCVLALSAAAVVVSGGRLEGVMAGSRRPLITLMAPKTYAESRASLLMSIFEMVAAQSLVGRGVEAVFMDGSYVSEMMAPFGYARDAYERLTASGGELNWELVEEAGERAARGFEEMIVSGGEPRGVMAGLLRAVMEEADALYRELSAQSFDRRWRKEALDFAVVYVEMTAYLTALKALLEAAERGGVGVFWVAKDAESRYVVEREGVVGWLNDLTLLDYAWREGENVYTALEGVRFGRPRWRVAWEELLSEVYERWGDYSVVYFKLVRRGAVMQMTYPSRVARGRLLDALQTLSMLSDQHGYPRPLSYVHHIAVLDPGLPRIVADELYRRARSPLLRSMLAPSGRVMLGLRW